MDSFELNKILGAILGTLLFVMGVGFLAEAIYHPSAHASGPGYALPGEAEGGGEQGGGEQVAAVPIGNLLAEADPVAGESSAKKCQSCHDFTQGGPNKTGPNLYDVVERLAGSHEGFAYSAAMLEHKDKGDIWTYDNLNAFIMTPKAFTPGTKMTFAGVKNDQERANIIAYLSTLSASPKPFPPAEAVGGETASGAQVVEGTSSESAPMDTPTPEGTAAPASSEAPAASSAMSASEMSSAPAQ
ncbi:MAG: cytochrome c family protein [Devosia sp.]